MTDQEKLLIIRLEQLDVFKTQLLNTVYTKPADGIPATDLAAAVQASLGKANTALQAADLNTLNSKVSALESLISEGDSPTAAIDKFNEIVAFLSNITNTQTLEGILAGINSAIAAKYTKPAGGIPAADLADAVQTSLGKADSAYQKPQSGIPASDLAAAVQASLGKADTALQEHQDISGKADKDADAVEGNIAVFDGNGNAVDSGKSQAYFQPAGSYKTQQTAVSDPTPVGSALAFIASFTQNANGEVVVTKKTMQAASATQPGSMSAAHFEKLEGIQYASSANIVALFE